jgi:transposase
LALPALDATLGDYLHEVDHAAARVERLETALDAAIDTAPAALRTVIAALQCLRGIRQVTAATIVSEVGPLSRFTHPRQLMGYSGTVPSEHSSGASVHRGAITKTGNAHLHLAKIESVAVDQGILGRILGYGTIIVRGTGGTQEPFRRIADPMGFRRHVQEQGSSAQART